MILTLSYRPRGGGDDRAPGQAQDKNYLEQQRARAEQRRIKMQVMLERQKDYVAKQKVGEDENDVPEKREEDQEGYDGIPLLLPPYFSIPFLSSSPLLS